MKPNLKIRPYSQSDQFFLLKLLRLNTPKYFAPEEETQFIPYLENAQFVAKPSYEDYVETDKAVRELAQKHAF